MSDQIKPTPEPCCHVTLQSRVPRSLEQTLNERFQAVQVDDDRLAIRVRVSDQAAARALLTALWDAGLGVRDVAIHQVIQGVDCQGPAAHPPEPD